MKKKKSTTCAMPADLKDRFIFTSGSPNPLNLDARDRRYLICEGYGTAAALAKRTKLPVIVMPPNTQ